MFHRILSLVIFSFLFICISCSENSNTKNEIKIIEGQTTKEIVKPLDTPIWLKQPLYVPGKIKIVLDAGHGGNDPGAINDELGVNEKNINRAIVDYMVQMADTSLFYIFETRKHDKNPHRHLRMDSAWMLQPEILLTIHTNSYKKDTSVKGFELSVSQNSLDLDNFNSDWFPDNEYDDTALMSKPNPNYNRSKKICDYIEKYYNRIPQIKNNGFKPRNDKIWMIYAGNFPSVLVEVGYLSNYSEALFLIDTIIQKNIAQSIWEGVIDYLISEKKIFTHPVPKKKKTFLWGKKPKPKLKTISPKQLEEFKKQYKDAKVLKQKVDSVNLELNKPPFKQKNKFFLP